ncbi:hypothetical protein H2198_006787 [Neophaeococcomyces mojaviensis]|uniref:Uncharacterized protein n=1 Tax=Neophaeococcomyces mojaviensis TaxID=3383035 RepID=A0ACC3A1V4_9EURO|nr:hypothetical protein H2198_006787 [Knufia sp. JES_112]
MHLTILVSVAALLSALCSGALFERQSCSSDFKICAPPGAKTETLGPVSSSWATLFNDVVNIVSGFSINSPAVTTVDPSGPARREMAFCCSNIADCLLVPNYLIPMCWDRFTTNVFFPDGTYGAVVTGDFNTSNGDRINLVYGDYTLRDGQKGNIYNSPDVTSMKPETSTLPMPKPWTSSGEGSAIPATGLGTTGSLSTGTVVTPATTQAPSIGESITIVATMTGCNHCPAYNTTIPGPTQSGTTRLSSTSVFTTGIIMPTPPNQAIPFPSKTAALGAVVAFGLMSISCYLVPF